MERLEAAAGPDVDGGEDREEEDDEAERGQHRRAVFADLVGPDEVDPGEDRTQRQPIDDRDGVRQQVHGACGDVRERDHATEGAKDEGVAKHR